VQASAELFHNLATGKWLLKDKDDFWVVSSTRDALILAGYLELNVIDQTSSDYLVVAKGSFKITKEEDGACQGILVPLQPQETPTKITIEAATVDFGLVDCLQGFHADHWVETEAVFGLEGVKSIGLRFYLPEVTDQGPKNLDCFMGETKLKSFELKRGETEEIWIDIPQSDTGREELTLKLDYKEPNADDERSLGMIFAEINVNLTEWASVETLL